MTIDSARLREALVQFPGGLNFTSLELKGCGKPVAIARASVELQSHIQGEVRRRRGDAVREFVKRHFPRASREGAMTIELV